MKVTFALAALEAALAADRQGVAGEMNIHTPRIDPRQVQADRHLVLVLADIHQRRPHARMVRPRPFRTRLGEIVEQPVDLIPQGRHLGKWVEANHVHRFLLLHSLAAGSSAPDGIDDTVIIEL